MLGALWEIRSPYVGGVLMLNTGVYPSVARESSLWRILEANPHPKYCLSAKACSGILRRSDEREKPLPPELEEALKVQAGFKPFMEYASREIAFHINQRDETIETGNVTGALLATPNMQMQTFVAGFSGGAGPSAGGIGYTLGATPTLKAASGGNQTPHILCLNDQGGQVMDCTEEVTGTLRSQEHGHQPLVYENHGIDGRYTGPYEVSPTIAARAGTGGNNLPLTLCIAGNAIDRQPLNGGNGIGYHEEVAYTLTAMDRHAVCTPYQETVGTLCSGDEKGVGNQYVSQDKLIMATPQLIRRLTPLECERLQGFPDHWTKLPSSSDTARYKALGNSVAIPCVEFVLQGIASVLMAA